MHNSIYLTNISKYFRFAKELALYRNDNYMLNVIYNGCSTQDYMLNVIYNGCSTQDYRDRQGNPTQLAYKRQSSDKRCNIYSPTLDTSYNAFCAKKNCTLYRGRVG